MRTAELKPNVTVRGSILPEPVKVITTVPMGDSIKLIAEGLETGRVHQPILTAEQVEELEISPEKQPFDGDAAKFRLGVEAMRLGLAYEYDPYFSLSIARVDPLPHQLEAVYDYFLKLPRIRFLLADDPGAGKTIMAGLLIKELKVRGLVRRVLIVAPANLCFQWQRELQDKFRDGFRIVRSDVLRSTYGANPWQDMDHVITSVSWVSRIEDARESLMRSRWDLIIVDEAHKMSAYNEEKKTLAYQLGEALSEMTDHYLLLTATPHKGDPENFSLFLRLLDRDVYADVRSLEKAIDERSAPFYLRRVKEALVTFPDPDTGEAKSLFTKRNVHTVGFQIDDEELDFYDSLTRYVEDQSIKASQDDSARGRALGFTMAMLQRRFASSIYAVRRTLERMKAKREKILEDPEAYRQEQIKPGTKQTFTAEGLDQFGREIETGTVKWSATGGEIGPDGVFAAGKDEGSFLVTVDAQGVAGTASVIITKEERPKPPTSPTALRKLLWTGEIAPQKWTNFYMRILTKLVSCGGVKLSISIEATPKDGVTDQQLEETKIALRGLGLNDDVRTE